MLIVEPYVKLIDEKNIYKKIELAGRVCYKSEDKITDTSYEKFITHLVSRGHYSVLEHSEFSVEADGKLIKLIPQQLRGHFYYNGDIISANVRAWRELMENFKLEEIAEEYPILFGDISSPVSKIKTKIRDKEEDLKIGMPHLLRESFIIRTSRDISHQIVRHRAFSISQESQRYCNYSLGKFDNNVKYIMPDFIKEGGEEIKKIWVDSRKREEEEYFNYLNMDRVKPENARNCLSNSTATVLVVTSSLWGWRHFLNLRLKSDAQKEIRDLAKEIKNIFLKKYKGTLLEIYFTP